MVQWRFERGVKEMMDQVKQGIYEFVPPKLLKPFDAHELELLISGVSVIDVDDWKKHTLYTAGFHRDHPTIKLFWQAIEEFDHERRARLLQFATGTSRLPSTGFKDLIGYNGPQKFTIKQLGEGGSLPHAHTCFNRLELPNYKTLEDMQHNLVLAIEYCGSFEEE